MMLCVYGVNEAVDATSPRRKEPDLYCYPHQDIEEYIPKNTAKTARLAGRADMSNSNNACHWVFPPVYTRTPPKTPPPSPLPFSKRASLSALTPYPHQQVPTPPKPLQRLPQQLRIRPLQNPTHDIQQIP